MNEKILPILPTPCTKVEEKAAKDWFQKINEELDELKAEILYGTGTPIGYAVNEIQFSDDNFEAIAEEAADTITAITSMLEAMGIDEDMRQAAQQCVNEKNKERGRF